MNKFQIELDELLDLRDSCHICDVEGYPNFDWHNIEKYREEYDRFIKKWDTIEDK